MDSRKYGCYVNGKLIASGTYEYAASAAAYWLRQKANVWLARVGSFIPPEPVREDWE